jgi:hypothetical protein
MEADREIGVVVAGSRPTWADRGPFAVDPSPFRSRSS